MEAAARVISLQSHTRSAVPLEQVRPVVRKPGLRAVLLLLRDETDLAVHRQLLSLRLTRRAVRAVRAAIDWLEVVARRTPNTLNV